MVQQCRVRNPFCELRPLCRDSPNSYLVAVAATFVNATPPHVTPQPYVRRPLCVCGISAIVEDDDEILLALAEALGQLVPAVGGPGHAALLLPR